MLGQSKGATRLVKGLSLLWRALVVAFPAILDYARSIGFRYTLGLPPETYRYVATAVALILMLTFFKEVWLEFRRVESGREVALLERDTLREDVEERISVGSPEHVHVRPIFRMLNYPNSDDETFVGWSIWFGSLVLTNQSDAVSRLAIRVRVRVEGKEKVVSLHRQGSEERTFELAPRRSIETSLVGRLDHRCLSEDSEIPLLSIEGICVIDLAMPNAPLRIVGVPLPSPFPSPKAPPPPIHGR